MLTANEVIEAQKVRQQFIVGPAHTNDKGELATCVILKEIMAANDQVILKTIGSLNYHKFFTTWHRVELGNEIALAGDTVELVSEYYFTQNISLEISVIVRRKTAGRNIILAEGYFSFTINREAQAVYLW